ncbi:transport and Golgi organization protein 2 isoform X4 [Glossina fuscipes]|uniref:Transport and Golgi organization protein 2 isoform X4 n=1 Tax=Glossina fuscipes TaxID=7396 RepID=A0A8U0W9G2_9MUSC|nr:transport and Golgi organization protein 2 isoform X4 [Glossina fuscipes]
MCVIFFYVNSSPQNGGYKLILASNRDEFYARDTRPAGTWISNEYVYGGIDLEPGREGGTWLAVSGKNGTFKVGALLNLTGEPKTRNSLGRGMIVTDYVSNFNEDFNNSNYNCRLVEDCSKYNAFNFVSLEIGSSSSAAITLCSNVPASLIHYPEEKYYGFGNSLPSVPFEKVRFGRDRFQAIVQNYFNSDKPSDENVLIKQLMDLLKCKQRFWPDAELMRRAPNWGEHLSAINVAIPNEGYGSRTHTVILIDANNRMQFIEETMLSEDPTGEWSCTHLNKQFF